MAQRANATAASSAAKNWERYVGTLVGQGRTIYGAAVLPITPEAPGVRKSVILAQKGISMRVPEATLLVETVMDGRVHRDYVHASGHQYLITTVMESSYYGRCTSTATVGGIALVKMGPFLVLAVWSEPTTAAQAIPYVHRSVDELAAAMGR